jgi:4-hydroxybenzoate polyprenyltransferase
MGGFLAAGTLSAYVSASGSAYKRPMLPEPELGLTYFFKAKYGSVYGTYCEHLAVALGPWMWGLAALFFLLITILKIHRKSRTYLLQICAAAAISLPIYYAVWCACR